MFRDISIHHLGYSGVAQYTVRLEFSRKIQNKCTVLIKRNKNIFSSFTEKSKLVKFTKKNSKKATANSASKRRQVYQ